MKLGIKNVIQQRLAHVPFFIKEETSNVGGRLLTHPGVHH
jgi:hypothetical protein